MHQKTLKKKKHPEKTKSVPVNFIRQSKNLNTLYIIKLVFTRIGAGVSRDLYFFICGHVEM